MWLLMWLSFYVAWNCLWCRFLQKIHFLFLIFLFLIVQLLITFSSCFKQGCQCLIMVTMVWLLAHNHNVISYYYHLSYHAKTLVQFLLKNIICHYHSKRHHSISKSPRFSVESGKKGWSCIKLLVPMAFLAIAHRHYTGIYKQMSNVLQCLKVVWLPYDCFV